jgi:hypothetical protein
LWQADVTGRQTQTIRRSDPDDKMGRQSGWGTLRPAGEWEGSVGPSWEATGMFGIRLRAHGWVGPVTNRITWGVWGVLGQGWMGRAPWTSRARRVNYKRRRMGVRAGGRRGLAVARCTAGRACEGRKWLCGGELESACPLFIIWLVTSVDPGKVGRPCTNTTSGLVQLLNSPWPSDPALVAPPNNPPRGQPSTTY